MYFFSGKKRSQAAIEFLIVIGVAFTMLLPAIFMFSEYSESSNQLVMKSQLNRIGKELISSVESIYYYGENSKTTLKISFPDNVKSVHLNPMEPPASNLTEIVFNISIFGGTNSVVFFSDVNITANFTADYDMEEAVSEGMKTFIVQSHGDYVNVTRKIT
jgi:hypothetical protein